MATADKLKKYVTSIADAIRAKEGSTELINSQDFPQRISNLQGGSGGNLEYLDVSQLVQDDFDFAVGLLYYSEFNKCSYYDESTDEFEYQISSSIIETPWDENTKAIAIDFSKIIIREYYSELKNSLHERYEMSLKDWMILELENNGYDNAEELLDSIPRITKEEFYAIPKKSLNGAWIQHIDGTLYTGDQWTAGGFSNDEANGVAAINEGKGVSFVVAKDKLGPMPWSSNPNTLINGVSTTTNWVKAQEGHYTGADDTTKIAAFDPNSAAAACMNYTFPNGQKGYLTSVGEFDSIYLLESKINGLMTLIGGAAFKDSFVWTSLQYSADAAWYFYFGTHDITSEPKSKNLECRPLCTLENYIFAE